jgi:predicted membrane-bound dolichyl-phosphate-mannose-protein mannosyltransferase
MSAVSYVYSCLRVYYSTLMSSLPWALVYREHSSTVSTRLPWALVYREHSSTVSTRLCACTKSMLQVLHSVSSQCLLAVVSVFARSVCYLFLLPYSGLYLLCICYLAVFATLQCLLCVCYLTVGTAPHNTLRKGKKFILHKRLVNFTLLLVQGFGVGR